MVLRGSTIAVNTCGQAHIEKLGFDFLLRLRDGHTHVLGKTGARLEELPDSAFRVVLALPRDLVGDTLVQGNVEWPRLSNSLAQRTCVKARTSDTAGLLHCKALDLGIGVVRLHRG